jgi:hypothetical protein
MKPKISRGQEDMMRNASSHEILILTDGRVLTHNLTPAVAAVLRELNPDDEPMRQRAQDLESEPSDELRERN